MNDVKIVQEMDRQTLKCLIIAAYCVGWDTGRADYLLDHPRVKREWDNLEELLNDPDKALKYAKV